MDEIGRRMVEKGLRFPEAVEDLVKGRKMTKVVINDCYGGFGLSHGATMEYGKRKGLDLVPYEPAKKEDGHWSVVEYTPLTSEKPWMILYRIGRDPEGPVFSSSGIPRDDPDLIDLVETWGYKADGDHARLRIVEVPDGIAWEIGEYDGNEWVAEKHQTWS